VLELLNKRHENVVDRLLTNKPYWDRPSSHFLTYRIISEEPVQATLSYKQGKCGTSPIGCRSKEGYVGRKTQANRGVVIYEPALALFAYMPLAWCSENSYLA
jgi:hypothetical protein